MLLHAGGRTFGFLLKISGVPPHTDAGGTGPPASKPGWGVEPSKQTSDVDDGVPSTPFLVPSKDFCRFWIAGTLGLWVWVARGDDK